MRPRASGPQLVSSALLGLLLASVSPAADVKGPKPVSPAAVLPILPALEVPGLEPSLPSPGETVRSGMVSPLEAPSPAAGRMEPFLAEPPRAADKPAPRAAAELRDLARPAQRPESDEGARASSDRIFDLARPAETGAEAVPGSLSAAVPGLSAAVPGAPAAALAEPRRPGPAARFLQGLKDRATHRRIYLRQLWWYTVTHIVDPSDRNMWPAYQAQWLAARASGRAFPISEPRRFFAHMRVMGESGIFYVLGFSSLTEGQVMEETRETFARYFTDPRIGPAERQALERFMARAYEYNRGKRSHANFRKHVRDALLAASKMPADKIAAHFDSLISPALAADTKLFQEQEQEAVLASFRAAAEETIREEDPKAPNRVVAVVLLGSFATKSPNRKSDFDFEIVTADGRKGRMEDFAARLKARWKALGLDRHPIGPHESPDPPSKGVLKRIHHSDYIVVSPDPELAAALSRAPGEEPFFRVERQLTWRGRLGRLVQFVGVYAATLYADLLRVRPK